VLQTSDLFLGLLSLLCKNEVVVASTQTLNSLSHTQTLGEREPSSKAIAAVTAQGRSEQENWLGSTSFK
jgi:hypothetical protein